MELGFEGKLHKCVPVLFLNDFLGTVPLYNGRMCIVILSASVFLFGSPLLSLE